MILSLAISFVLYVALLQTKIQCYLLNRKIIVQKVQEIAKTTNIYFFKCKTYNNKKLMKTIGIIFLSAIKHHSAE
jgi:hypothetical protein